jgi:hypothetical protein
MRVHFVIVLFALFLGAAVILGCKRKEVPRPPGLPSSAIWAGGEDGGSFIDCTPSRSGEPNECTVYDESGSVYMERRNYTIQGSKRGARLDELRYEYADGSNIGLKGGLTLTPVPHETFGSPSPASRR